MTFDECRISRAMFDWALKVGQIHWRLYCYLMHSVTDCERQLLGCESKEAFVTFEAAAVVAAKMMRREANTLVHAYRCHLCGSFHVAHRNTKTLRAQQQVKNLKRRVHA